MDFTYLVAKRRIEKDLNDVVYIQSFMRPKKGLSNLLHIKYLYENEKNKDLFRKALEEISIISNYNITTPTSTKVIDYTSNNSYYNLNILANNTIDKIRKSSGNYSPPIV